MSWGLVAVAGVTAVSAYSSSKSASRDADNANAATAESLAFEQEKYDDWKETYGGIEDNLSDYYSSLTPEYFEAQGLESFQQEYQTAMTNVQSTLAQRGIEDSGIALATEVSGAQSAATNRATIRAQAPSLAAEEQRSFLQVGLGQNPGASYSRSLAENANRTGQDSRASQQAAGQAVGSAIRTAGTALSSYLSQPAAPVPATTYSTPSANQYTDTSGYA